MAEDYVIEMLHITKEFPGIKANDDITLQLRKGEVHALLGENGAGKSTLMSVLFGLYQPEQGKILKNGKEVAIRNPNDANALGIGMVHQHFKLVECFSVLDNIILGVEPNKMGFLQKAEARKKVMALSEKYGLRVDPDALVSDISVGMQQRAHSWLFSPVWHITYTGCILSNLAVSSSYCSSSRNAGRLTAPGNVPRIYWSCGRMSTIVFSASFNASSSSIVIVFIVYSPVSVICKILFKK